MNFYLNNFRMQCDQGVKNDFPSFRRSVTGLVMKNEHLDQLEMMQSKS